MKLQQILNKLQRLHPKEIDLSLDRIKKLCNKLGNPQDNLQYISVVGTNGKYSTIQATVKEELTPDFQTAEFVEKHGFVDKVLNRKDLTNEIGKLLEILLKKNSEVNSELINETSTNIEQPTKAAS